VTPDDAEEYTQALGQVFSGGWRQIHLGQRLGVPKALGLSVQDWVTQRLGGYVQLGIPDRRQAVIELVAEGLPNTQIAAVLGVNEKTVRRDHASANAEAHQLKPSDTDHASAIAERRIADLEEARERSAHIREHRSTHPEQFAAEEIFSVLTFALNEADKWTPYVPPVAKTPPGQWALMHERLLAITALVRRMCEPAEIDTHRAHARDANERRHAASS